MADTQRYWDGSAWTDHVAPGLPQHVVAQAQRAEEAKSNNGLFTAAIVMMVIFPIGGFIGGAVLLARRAAAAGALIMMMSVASGYLWFAVIDGHREAECRSENIDRIIDGLPALPC